MSQMLSVNLTIESNIFLQCNYIHLDPCAPNSGRTFVFSGIKSKSNLINDNCLVTIDITVCNKNSEFVNLIQFELFVFRFYDMPNGDWSVYGHLMNLETTEYRQGEIDVFNNWQNGVISDWFSNTFSSDSKLDYISACLTYSGLPTKILDKNLFQFDLSLIKEERDFYYLASLELVGDKAYLGHDFHTFRDCFLELYNHNGFFDNKRVKFINSIQSDSIELANLIDEIKAVFKRYKFYIE